MNPLLTLIKEKQEEFGKEFSRLFDGDLCDNHSCTHYHSEDAMKDWNTQFLISLLEGERERLQREIITELCEDEDTDVYEREVGYNQAITDQIFHINEALAYLKSNV